MASLNSLIPFLLCLNSFSANSNQDSPIPIIHTNPTLIQDSDKQQSPVGPYIILGSQKTPGNIILLKGVTNCNIKQEDDKIIITGDNSNGSKNSLTLDKNVVSFISMDLRSNSTGASIVVNLPSNSPIKSISINGNNEYEDFVNIINAPPNILISQEGGIDKASKADKTKVSDSFAGRVVLKKKPETLLPQLTIGGINFLEEKDPQASNSVDIQLDLRDQKGLLYGSNKFDPNQNWVIAFCSKYPNSKLIDRVIKNPKFDPNAKWVQNILSANSDTYFGEEVAKHADLDLFEDWVLDILKLQPLSKFSLNIVSHKDFDPNDERLEYVIRKNPESGLSRAILNHQQIDKTTTKWIIELLRDPNISKHIQTK